MLSGVAACDKADSSADTDGETTAAVTVTEQVETVAETEFETETEAETEITISAEEARLNELFANKTQLRFDENGEFRILILSDLHMPAGGAPKEVMNYIKQTVEQEQPHFVILNGDNVVATSISREAIFSRTLKELATYLESKGIYFMHVFGNHDVEMKLSLEEQQAIYETYPNCLSKDTDKEVTGVGNYVIPIYGSADEEIKFTLWGIDSGNYISAEDKAALFPQGITGFKGYDGTGYDFIHYDQIEWYRNTSELIESYYGRKIPGLMAFHIPLQEFYSAWENRGGIAEWSGSKNEAVCASPYNSGLFEVLRQRGDIKAVSCGHDHVNDYMVNYAGIKLCYASTVTTTTYGGPIGARMFVIQESDPADVQTYMTYLFDEE
jgi:hypothetical protein